MYIVNMKINKLQQEELAHFACRNGIRFIVLFGSQVKDKHGKDADYDIAVSLKDGRSITCDFDLYSDIIDGLTTIFQIPHDKIDLTDLYSANILLRYEIISRGELLFGDELDYLELKSFAFRDYLDAGKLLELEDLLIRKRQKLILDALPER